jgi:hypothetical protein
MLVIASLVIFFLYLLYKGKLRKGRYGVKLIALYGILAVNIISMRFRWQYHDTQIIWFLLPFTILLMYFVMSDLLRKKENYDYFLKVAEIICIIV